MTTTTDVTPAPERPAQGEIVATAGTYYRVARYVIFVVIMAMGLWFGYDGFINWPEQNRRIDELDVQRLNAENAGNRERAAELLAEMNAVGTRHSDWDLFLQRVLFFTLPPVGIILLVRWLYISRGAYRLTPDNALHVPGHPRVPLDSITEIDRRLWDRKGIAYITYELPDGQKGTLKLDDFIYQREPTDEIFKRIEDYVAPHAEATSTGDGGEPATAATHEQERSAG